jgi:hypothetical protein
MVPHTPYQNGVSKRKNRAIVECARSMLKGKNIFNSLWVEAINTTMYLQDRSPTKFLENKTSYEAFKRYKLVGNHLIFLGSESFSYIQKEDEMKHDAIESNAFSLVILTIIKLTKCMILLLIKYLKVGMLYFMSMHMMLVKMY